MSKLIVVGPNKQALMTFDEVYARYQPLLKKKAYAWSKNCEYDEMFQLASIALWKAYEKYDSALHPIAFGWFAGKFIDNALLAHYSKSRKCERPTSQVKTIVSLHGVVYDNKGNETELQDLIGEDETFTHEVTENIVLDKIFKKIPPAQLQDVMNYLSGHSQSELASSNNTTQVSISRKLQQSFAKFKALYVKEMMV
jgi:RNA polymerase sigma factor (sigma-70 family)